MTLVNQTSQINKPENVFLDCPNTDSKSPEEISKTTDNNKYVEQLSKSASDTKIHEILIKKPVILSEFCLWCSSRQYY